jgi:hypothetical protein
MKKFPEDLLPQDDCSFLGSTRELGSVVFQVLNLPPERWPINPIFCKQPFERADGSAEAILSLADLKLLSSRPAFIIDAAERRVQHKLDAA